MSPVGKTSSIALSRRFHMNKYRVGREQQSFKTHQSHINKAQDTEHLMSNPLAFSCSEPTVHINYQSPRCGAAPHRIARLARPINATTVEGSVRPAPQSDAPQEAQHESLKRFFQTCPTRSAEEPSVECVDLV
eukprot:6173662-Pleurochrysis_carterae.AAC.2